MQEDTYIIPEGNEEAFSLRDFILKFKEWGGYLISRWYFLLAFTMIGAAIGYWVVSKKPTYYIATTSFVLEGTNQSATGSGLASMMGLDVGTGGLFQGENILELYRSRSMIIKTLLTNANFEGHTELLIHRYIKINNLRQTVWKDDAKLRNISFNESNRYADNEQIIHNTVLLGIVKDILNNYLVIGKPDKRVNIINVTVKSTDELFSKAFDEAIVENVNSFYLDTKTKKTRESIAVMQRKADSIKAVATGSIYAAAAIEDATPNLNPTRQAQRTAPVETARMRSELSRGILNELVRNIEMSKMELQSQTPLIAVIDDPILPLDVEGPAKGKYVLAGGMAGILIVLVLLIIIRIFNRAMRR